MTQPSIQNLLKDKKFCTTALSIGIPVIFANLITIGLNMMDTLMIGKLGLEELAGVGAANRIYSVFIIICFGFYSGSAVHLAQYWGIRDIPNMRRLVGVDLTFAIGFSLLVMVAGYLFAPSIIDLFLDEPQVIDYGVEYLRAVLLSYGLASISLVFSFLSRSIHRLLAPTLINGVAFVVNTVLNYCLIFGKLGFPELGVKGAAVATVIARAVELLAMLLYIYTAKEHPLAARLKEMFAWDKPFLKMTIRTTIPVVLSEGAWSSGQALYYIAYGNLGFAAQAVVQVSSVVSDLFQTIFFGVGNACAVMIGNELGRGKRDLAYTYSQLFLRITAILCIIMTVLLLLSRNVIINIYDYDPATNAVLRETLVVYALFNTPRMLTYTLLVGILRAGGDTSFSSTLDILGIWCIGVPLAFLSAKVWGLSLSWVIALSLSDEIIKTFICLWRMKSRKWMHVLTMVES